MQKALPVPNAVIFIWFSWFVFTIHREFGNAVDWFTVSGVIGTMKLKFYLDLGVGWDQEGCQAMAVTHPLELLAGNTRVSFEVEIPDVLELPPVLETSVRVAEVGKMLIASPLECYRVLFTGADQTCIEQQALEICDICQGAAA
jgi:hypothetical protein